MTEFLRALEAIEPGKSWLLAAAIAGLAIALFGITRRPGAFHASNRSVSALPNGLAGSAALFTAAPFLSLAGVLYILGSDGLAWLVGLGAGLVLMGVLIAPAFRASGALSVSGFLAARYGGRLVPLLATLVVAATCFALLATQLAVIGSLVEDAFAIHRVIAIAWATLLLAVAIAGGGVRSVTWLSIGLGIVILAAYLAPLGAMAMAQHGVPFGFLAYGETLGALRELEIDMISAGLADAASLKPHLSQFLQVDHSNTLALIVTVMAGTAVLPHVLMRQAVTAGVKQTRLAMAWTLLLAAAVLSAVPAYAAMSKHEIYRLVAKGVPFAEVPEVFAQENVRVHGVPFSLFNSLISVLHPPVEMRWSWQDPYFEFAARTPVDGNDAAGVAAALKQTSPRDFAAWSLLPPEVQKTMLGAAQGDILKSEAKRFETWRATVLPAAAIAAGNQTGKLTASALAVEADTVAFLGMKLAGIERGWISLFALGAVLAAFATALATAWAVARCLGSDLPSALRGSSSGAPAARADLGDTQRTLPIRLAGLVVAPCAATAALCLSMDFASVLAWSLSVLAAGLFPALVMGIWWRRTTAAGALAGMLTGLAVTLVYIAGTQLAPHAMPQLTLPSDLEGETAHDDAQTFAETPDDVVAPDSAAPAGSPASEPAFGEDPALPAQPGPSVEVATTAEQGLAAAAGRQTAAWFGIHDRAAAVFGLPLGFLVIILISLVSRRPSAAAEQFVWAIRRPGA